MKRSLKPWVLFAGASLTALTTGAAYAQTTAPAAAATPPAVSKVGESKPSSIQGGVQEVVVTATRRETLLQRTPQAISVLSGADQAARGETRLEDLQTSVPNLTFAATSDTSQFFIRGIGTTFLSAGGDPGVAFYQDGAYVSDQTTTNTSLFDVQRVEVLRGPQGALLGRNAVGGAISIISAQPTDDYHGSISVTGGDYGRAETEGFVSGPIGAADTDLRISYQIKHHDGYITNDAPASAGGPRDFDDLDSQAVRIQSLTHLPDAGTLKVLFSFFNEADHGDALALTPTPGVAYPAQQLYGLVPSSNPWRVFANSGLERVQVFTGSIEYDQPLGFADLTVTGNYRGSSQHFENDCDGTAINLCNYDRATNGVDYYFDTHLASRGGGDFKWLVGATYLRFDETQLNAISSSFPLSYVSPLAPSNIPFFFQTNAGGHVATQSYAFYTDLRYQLTPVWALTGQARYNDTTRDATEVLEIPQFGINVPAFPNSLHNSFVPFKVGVEGQVTRTALLYLNYATAYKDGAINLGSLQTVPVKPEEVQTVEGGFKTSFFERHLQFNGAAFHTDYTNLQVQQVLQASAVLANVPKSTIDGAELDVIVTPVSGLQVSLDAGYLDAKFDQFFNRPNVPGLGQGPLEDLTGNKLPYVAPFSVNTQISYDFSPIEGYSARIGADYSVRGRTYFDEYNQKSNSQGAVGIVDASGSIGPTGKNWKLFFYIKNLTNETVQSGATVYAGTIGAARAVSYEAPRNFGIGASYAF